MRRPPREPDGAMGRPAPNVNLFGIALVIIATALGIYLIARSFDHGTTKTSTATTTTTTSTTVAGTDTTAVSNSSSTSTGGSSSSVNLGNVKVLVLNASGKSGSAGKLANTLQAAGFTASKGTAKSLRATTIVYYVGGAKAEALAVASVVNLGADAVQLMPQPAPVDTKTLADNKVVVLLGTDKAT